MSAGQCMQRVSGQDQRAHCRTDGEFLDGF